jgi:cobalt-zinc-cadmium efflux system protein
VTAVHAASSAAPGRLRGAFLLNLAFALFELAGGLWTNSMAVLSDALHDLGDALALASAWKLEEISERGGDDLFSYGYRRFSLVGAVVTAVVLLVGAAVILVRALPRLVDPVMPDARGMVLFALVGIAVNGFAAWRMRHGHSASEQMAIWHLVEDVLGWVAVLVVAVAMTRWHVPILDPLLSILIALLVVARVLTGLRAPLRVFLQAAPAQVAPSVVSAELTSLPGVRDVHHLHVWSLDGEHHVLTAHMVVEDGLSQPETLELRTRVKRRLAEIGISDATLEIETEADGCVEVCHFAVG